MAFSLVPALPFVADTDAVPSAVLNAWRTFFASCLDADGGGTYLNTTPILWDVGSAEHQYAGGLRILSTGFLTVDVGATLTVAGALAVTGALTSSGGATFTGAVAINAAGSLTLASGVNLAVGGSATVTGTLTGNGTTNLTGSTSITGNITQPLTITATQPSASADPGANNRIHSTNVPKAWAYIRISPGGITVLDGYNIQSAAVGTTTKECRVTFARSMANGTYVTVFGTRSKDFQATSANSETTTFLEFNVTRSSDGTDLDIASPVTTVNVVLTVFGRQ